MTETTFPFQPAPVADGGTAAMPEDSNRSRLVLVTLGGLGALAVLAVAAYFLLFSGESDDSAPAAAAPVPNAAAQPQPPPSTAPSTAPSTKALPRISAKNFGTDPFKPLITEAAALPAGAAVDTTTPGGSAATGGTTSGGAATGTSGTTTPTGSTAYRFQVVDVAVGNKSIDVKVDGKTYNSLAAGDVFAGIFKVRFIAGASNSFQIGDEIFNVVGTKAVTISG